MIKILFNVVNPDTLKVPNIYVLLFNVVNPEIFNDYIRVPWFRQQVQTTNACTIRTKNADEK